jgi:hypothetical protein
MMVDQSAMKFIELFAGTHDGPFSPNPGEVSQLEFVALSTIQIERSAGTRHFTETFLHLLDFYLQSSSTAP